MGIDLPVPVIIGAVIILILFVWNYWAVICIDKTGSQKLNILDKIYENKNDWERLANLYDEVSFDDHYRSLFWGRDPYKLYHKDIQKLVE